MSRTMQELSDRIRGSLRKNDIYTRIGPLQYAVLLTHTTYEGGCTAAKRIINQVRRSYPSKNTRISYTLRPLCPKS